MARGGKFLSRKHNRRFYGSSGQLPSAMPVPKHLVPFGHFSHACLDEAICQVDIDQVPYFSAPIFTVNCQHIGNVDEVFGTMQNFLVSLRLNNIVKVKTFKNSDKFFIEPHKLLPITRFLPKPKLPKKNIRKPKLQNQQPNRKSCRGKGKLKPIRRSGLGRNHSFESRC